MGERPDGCALPIHTCVLPRGEGMFGGCRDRGVGGGPRGDAGGEGRGFVGWGGGFWPRRARVYDAEAQTSGVPPPQCKIKHLSKRLQFFALFLLFSRRDASR